MSSYDSKPLSIKKMIGLGFLVVAFIVVLVCGSQIIETVDKGTYQIKQTAIFGTLHAKMTPGVWFQWFGDIDAWPKAETMFFTHDKDTKDDIDKDLSIEVRFQDGSLCRISGTVRVLMPTSEQDVISLVDKRGHKTYGDLQSKLLLPTIRKVLRSTANLMTARESYSENRLDYVEWAGDQIENGVYQTDEKIKEIEDLVTGEKVKKKVKVIRRGDNGQPLYRMNPLANTGIVLANFEIKEFRYEKKVQAQIATQQTARMNVETAKAKAEEARQKELQSIAEGKANVAKAQYEEEQKKIRAVVEAQKNKEVAELDAARKLEVAKLARLSAKETKQANILDGQGLAEKRRLIIQADGALKQKLETYERVNAKYASAIENYSGNWVPTTVMGGNSGNTAQNGATQLIDLLTVKTAKDLALDMEIKKKKE